MPLVQACSAGSARVPPPREKFGHGGRKQAVRKRRQIDFDSSTPESRIGRSLLFVFRLHRLFAFRWISGLGGLSATPAQLRTQGRWIRENGDFAQSGKFEVWKTKTAGMRDQSVRTSYLDTTNDFGAISEATRRRRLLREICSILHLARAPRLNKPNRRFFDIRFLRAEGRDIGGLRFRGVDLCRFCAWEGQGNRGGGSGVTVWLAYISLSRVEWVELGGGLGGLSGLVDGWLSTPLPSPPSQPTPLPLQFSYYSRILLLLYGLHRSSSSNTYVQWDAHFCGPFVVVLRLAIRFIFKYLRAVRCTFRFIELTGSTGIRRRENVCQSMDMIYLLMLSLSSTSNCGWSEFCVQLLYSVTASHRIRIRRVDLLSFYSVNEFSIFELDEFEQDLYKNRFISVIRTCQNGGGGRKLDGARRPGTCKIDRRPRRLCGNLASETCLRLGGRSGSGGSRRDGGTKAALASWWRRIDTFGVFGTPPNGGGGGEFGCSARGGVSAASGRRGRAAGGGGWVAASPQASYESVSTGKEGYEVRTFLFLASFLSDVFTAAFEGGRWWWRVGGGRTRSPLNFCLSRRSSQEEVRQYRDSDFVGKAGPEPRVGSGTARLGRESGAKRQCDVFPREADALRRLSRTWDQNAECCASLAMPMKTWING
ncbi:hypothetical protein R3P38DRAFT_3564818 [Favolaschia claudopus]|uniref:Uncharacterized protein n=1 Tax=Favolaschia claudopus TaxID=2862362 RepID=A0AAW0DVS9_9AGAR